MTVGDASADGMVQVMKAVEDAMLSISQLNEENSRLKEELALRMEELKLHKMDLPKSYKPTIDATRNENTLTKDNHMRHIDNESDRLQWIDNNSAADSVGMIVLHQNGLQKNDMVFQHNVGDQHYSDYRGNGFSNALPNRHANSYNPGNSQFSSPSSRSISPIRLQKGDFDVMANLSGQAQRQMPEINSSTAQLKQDLIFKIREHEEEVLQLRRHLVDYSMKEAQLRNEKYVLEKRIAHMRMAFDQQQKELVDAASKALSYRQEIIEENIRLTYALQSAHQDWTTFVSCLLPLLSEYDLQPQTNDANSIVSNLKVLFRHLHEKLVRAEEKLKESNLKIAPWRAEASNNPNLSSQLPADSIGTVKYGLELVPQSMYPHVQSPVTSPFNAPTRSNVDVFGQQTIQASSQMSNSTKNIETTPVNRVPITENIQAPVSTLREEAHTGPFIQETKETWQSSKDLPGENMMDYSDEVATQPVSEPPTRWGNNGSPNITGGAEDPHVSYPFLPPLPEEHSSSFSEAAEDDPLPAIDALQIPGEAYPGKELQACGYSINGTTSCNFEWVRYREDGSVNYIDGAKQPSYLVTADDVDFYLAIQVQPLDDRKRKGELVEVFANDHRKILCDHDMQVEIERILSVGNAQFQVSIATGVGNIWEQAILGIKTEGYNIKCNVPRTEKFSRNVEIWIPYDQPNEFVIQTSAGDQHILMSPNRDTIVLTMRLFKKRAIERRRRKTWFFK